ncbi:MAG: Na+/H+ antiporter NhaA [Romboutsia sp.]|uniref:Na+/H+ antiporter NhaA n=1 Tax=Romboutsia sp. TaxID=1965302 RepID=UPI00216E2915|nr:Na+/H+ antiporter NhaA [Romboutsia sp.]MCI6668340.1 Na+/H+ antiporter NhaA [Romboutsia timonensis]MCI9260123.1 Na+/H+ antiporter NhaA [Romboutsia sp.]
MRLLRTYRKSIKIEALTSIFLLIATIFALFIYNTPLKNMYDYILNDIYIVNEFSIHMFINEFLMSIFFLVAGLEIKSEILYGNLSSLKKASFPVFASIGGVIVPALIFILINRNSPFLSGFCIPISTDIAFAVGIFILFSNKFNPALKVFLLSLAVVDDLISIAFIAIVYSLDINFTYLIISFAIFITLIIANKLFKIESIIYYLISGLCLWYFVHLSGLHSTISGIILAITIPSKSYTCRKSTLDRLQCILVPINSLFIIPLFAFANTGISLTYNIDLSSAKPLYMGIILGLSVGKPLGIMLFCYLGDLFKFTEKPKNISWLAIFFVSLIAGIGFTMSIFISELAFIHNLTLVNIAKMAILISASISIAASFLTISIYIYVCKLKNKTTRLTNKYLIS